MVVMLKTNPLIDECPEATRPTSHKPILVHGNGGGARFQSFSTTAMATVRNIEFLIHLFYSLDKLKPNRYINLKTKIQDNIVIV